MTSAGEGLNLLGLRLSTRDPSGKKKNAGTKPASSYTGIKRGSDEGGARMDCRPVGLWSVPLDSTGMRCARKAGLEPVISSVTGWRFYQLSYFPLNGRKAL